MGVGLAALSSLLSSASQDWWWSVYEGGWANATAFLQWHSWLRGDGFEPPTFGLPSHSDLELLIGQPSDSRRADSFSEQLAQSMKCLSAMMIPTSLILPCCVRQMVGYRSTRADTRAVCESHLGSNKKS